MTTKAKSLERLLEEARDRRVRPELEAATEAVREAVYEPLAAEITRLDVENDELRRLLEAERALRLPATGSPEPGP